MAAVIAPGPVTIGIPIGLIAMSSCSKLSSVSEGVILVLGVIESSILRPLLKNIIPPIILKASMDIEYIAKMYLPRYAKITSTIKPVRVPFLAIDF